MDTNNYFHIILGVLSNFYVIGTVLVMIFVIKFAKFVTTYKKRPPRVKAKKQINKNTAPVVENSEENKDDSKETSDNKTE